MGGEVSKETSTHPNSFPVDSISDNYLLPSTLDFCSETQHHQENLSPSKKSELSSYAKNNLKSLDPGFEDEILECEIELEKDHISFENLAKLVDLYMEAMSFYEAQQCSKYKYYANKLQTLMLKPKIDEVIVKESFSEESAKDDKGMRMSRLNSAASQTDSDLSPQKLKLIRRLTSRKRTSTILTQSTAYGSSEVLSRGDEERDLDSSYREDNLMQIIEIDECGKKEISDDENIEGSKERNRRRTYSACLSSQLSKSGFKSLSISANKAHSLEMENLSAKAYNKILFSLKQ